ncbi:MAG: cytochrome P450 [Caldilineaceae bacterium]
MAMIVQSPPKVSPVWMPRFSGTHHHLFLNFLADARARYGDIYTLNLGIKQAVILSHPRHAQHLFRDHAAHYAKGGALMTPLRSISGGGVTTSSGPLWRAQRHTLQPFFQRQQIATQVTSMITILQEWLAHYLPQPLDATPINISELLVCLTAQLTTATLFQTALPTAQIGTLNRALTALNQRALPGVLLPIVPAWFPLPGRRRYQAAIRQVDQVIDTLIIERQQTKPPGADLFTALQLRCAASAPPAAARRQLHDEVLALLIAGYETTATCLSWSCYLLAHHPAVLAKAQQEIDQQLGARQPTYADLAALPYLSMILYEALRLYPPSWRLSRGRGGRSDRRLANCTGAIGAHPRLPDPPPPPVVAQPGRFSARTLCGGGGRAADHQRLAPLWSGQP